MSSGGGVSVPTTSIVKHPDVLMSVGVVAILMVMLLPDRKSVV